MKTSLPAFKDRLLDDLLAMTWSQWSALGVPGATTVKPSRVIDPEALLVFSCAIARYDSRLFDEILNWLVASGSLLNIQRLKTILAGQKHPTIPRKILSAAAELLLKNRTGLKWKGLKFTHGDSGSESLFLHKDNKPLRHYGPVDPVFQKHGLVRGKINFRNHTLPVPAANPQNALFKLRSLIGISARCEILVYLLTHASGHPSLIGREIHYSQKTVQDALVEMAQSGMVFCRVSGKEKHYYLHKPEWMKFLHYASDLEWVNWVSLFSVFLDIQEQLNSLDLRAGSPLLFSSELRRLMKSMKPAIETSGINVTLSDENRFLETEYLPVFISDISRLLKLLTADLAMNAVRQQ